MKFGPLPLADALGHVLAHSMQAQSGRIAKGTVLTAPHLADLAGAGHSTVTVAQLTSTDVPEDAAAQRLAAALCAAPDLGLRASGAGAGRVNLIATDRKSTRLNSSHITRSRMPSSA